MNPLHQTDGYRKQLARLREAQATYPAHAARARGEKCHLGPKELRSSLPPRDCLKWARENKTFHPYTYFESASNVAKPIPKKSKGPPALWLPQSTSEAREEAKKAAKVARKAAEQAAEQERLDEELGVSQTEQPEVPKETVVVRLPGNTIADRPVWKDASVMYSRMNHEVQTFCREYFDNPKLTDQDLMPNVRERYCMNDRQMGWNDEPSLLGEPKRTYLDNVGEINLTGPKCQQLPSYWRRINDWRAFSETDLTAVPVPAISRFKNRNMLEALANTPADTSKKFWRTWSQTSANRLPKATAPIKKKKAAAGSYAAMKEAEKQEAAPIPLAGVGEARKIVKKPRPSGIEGWDNRWSVMLSKDNDQLPVQERMFFRKVEYLNGNCVGHEAVRPKNRCSDPYKQPAFSL